MKYLLLLILVYPSILWAEMVCPLLEGCPIRKGGCVGCIESDPIQTESPKPVILSEDESVKNKKPQQKQERLNKFWVGTLWKCVVGCWEGVGYWDDGGNCYDKDRNLIVDKSVRC